MQPMLTTDRINLFSKADAGAPAICALDAGTQVDADEQTIDYNTKQGDFRFRRVKCGKLTGYALDVYLEVDRSRKAKAVPAGDGE